MNKTLAFFVCALVGLLALALSPVAYSASSPTAAGALAACQNTASWGRGYSSKWEDFTCRPAGGEPDGRGYYIYGKGYGIRKGTSSDEFLENFLSPQAPPPGFTCAAGSSVPSGTPYKYYQSSGTSCTASPSGEMCSMSMVVGGSRSGSFELTGEACPGTGSPAEGATTKASETVNADGGKTYCDPISGKCVTVSPRVADAPASSSSSANSSTKSSTTTSDPGSTTESTTTSESNMTTTGDGSGSGSGTGNSTSTTTGTSTTTTTTPPKETESESECKEGACDVGNADGNMGQMYQAGTETPASVYSEFKARVSSSPLVGSATGFFDMSNVSGGTCPTWHIPGNDYWGQAGFSFDFFCSAGMLALFALAGWLVLGVGAFSAFRIAIY